MLDAEIGCSVASAVELYAGHNRSLGTIWASDASSIRDRRWEVHRHHAMGTDSKLWSCTKRSAAKRYVHCTRYLGTTMNWRGRWSLFSLTCFHFCMCALLEVFVAQAFDLNEPFSNTTCYKATGCHDNTPVPPGGWNVSGCDQYCASVRTTNFYMGPIHPRDKKPVGVRLAKASMAVAYVCNGFLSISCHAWLE